MSYREKFKGLLMGTAKGFAIGLIPTVLFLVLMMSNGFGFDFYVFLVFEILFGAIAAIIVTMKSGMGEIWNQSITNMMGAIKSIFFSGIFKSQVFLAIGIIKMIIGILIMVPVGLFMSIFYVLNFLYLGTMSILEKYNKLEGKSALCEKMDKAVTIISGVIVVALIIYMFTH